MNFSLATATDFLQDKITAFFDLFAELSNLRRKTVALIWNYIELDEDATPAYGLLADIDNDLITWKTISIKLRPFAEFFGYPVPTNQLGIALTVVLSLTAVALAGSMFLFFQKVANDRLKLENLRDKLSLIREGKITFEQSQQLDPGSVVESKLSGFSLYALLAVGGYFLFSLFKR